MTLKESENGSSDGEWERPDDWERISLDELPDPDYEKYPMPDPEDLERVPADEFYES